MDIKARIFGMIYMLGNKATYRFLILLDWLRRLDFYRVAEYQIDDCCDYECTHLRMMRMLKGICKEATTEDAILDVGCGKGKMLWFFSAYQFRLVDGIEYNPDMAAIARDNIRKLHLSSQVFETDACIFSQWENYNWFYFYNPVSNRVMDICLQNMVESLQKKKRILHVIYANPVCHSKLVLPHFVVFCS